MRYSKLYFLFEIMLIIALSGCGREQNKDYNIVEISVDTVDFEEEQLGACEIENTEKLYYEEKWYELLDYPIKSWADAQMQGMDFMEWIDILNPPADLLETFSTEKLVYLALRYPAFPYLPSFPDEEAEQFCSNYYGYSDIFKELRSREEANLYIIQDFSENIPNIEAYNSGQFYTGNESIWLEIFMDNYVMTYYKEFSSKEVDLYNSAVEYKYQEYYSQIDDERAILGIIISKDGLAVRRKTE